MENVIRWHFHDNFNILDMTIEFILKLIRIIKYKVDEPDEPKLNKWLK